MTMKSPSSTTTQPPAPEPPDPETRRQGDQVKINGHAQPARGPVLDIPTEEDRKAALDAFFGAVNRTIAEQRAAVAAAKPALARLCGAMRQRTGQSFTIRTLLYSLWNGQPASLLEFVTLDWALRQDLCAVLLGFGFEDRKDASAHFFYDAMKAALVSAGLFDWFIAAGSEVAA